MPFVPATIRRMITHETVNLRYSTLQSLLRETFRVDGRGIIEIMKAIEPPLPYRLSVELRLIGLIRNQIVHEGLADVPRYFEALCKSAIAGIKQMRADKKAATQPKRAAVSKPMTVSKPAARVAAKKSAPAKGIKKPAVAKKKRSAAKI